LVIQTNTSSTTITPAAGDPRAIKLNTCLGGLVVPHFHNNTFLRTAKPTLHVRANGGNDTRKSIHFNAYPDGY